MNILKRLKTVMAVMEERKKGFIFMMIDFVSLFDREDIFAGLETLDKIEVNKKAKQIRYLLNKDTKIQVKIAHRRGVTKDQIIKPWAPKHALRYFKTYCVLSFSKLGQLTPLGGGSEVFKFSVKSCNMSHTVRLSE